MWGRHTDNAEVMDEEMEIVLDLACVSYHMFIIYAVHGLSYTVIAMEYSI